jgi:hypothetical protein
LVHHNGTGKRDIMSELHSFFDLLGMLVTDPRTGVLLALLVAAAVSDYRTYRIPNWLTMGGILFALVYNAVVPPVWHAGWTWAPAGLLLGLGAMLPMYAIGAMGAGDVKLMAMIGAFLGVSATMQALLFSVVTGGLAALRPPQTHDGADAGQCRRRHARPAVVRRRRQCAQPPGRGHALGRQARIRHQHRHGHHRLPGRPAAQSHLSLA